MCPPRDRFLSPRPETPSQETRVRLQAFYRSNRDYSARQASHDSAYFARFSSVVCATIPERTRRVLEVGAGAGRALRPLIELRRSVQVAALDLSHASLLHVAEAELERVMPVQGDALVLPFEDDTFDAVVGFEVIEHLPDVPGAVDEMLRVLRTPGYVVFGLPNHASLWTPIEDAIRGRRRLAFGVDGRVGALRWWSRNLRLMMQKRLSRSSSFHYREPRLTNGTGGDADAAYYSCPLDLIRLLRERGARLVQTSAHVRFGPLGWLPPHELQGSAVIAWSVGESS